MERRRAGEEEEACATTIAFVFAVQYGQPSAKVETILHWQSTDEGPSSATEMVHSVGYQGFFFKASHL